MRRASFLVNVIMSVLIIVLSGTLVFTMFSYRTQEQQRTAALKQEAERVRQEEEKKAQAQAEAERAAQEEAEAAAAAEAEAALPFAFSCRGESWQTDGANRADGWPAMLEALFDEDEVEAEVSDYTWDMAGTLSQLRFAGVSAEIVDGYIDSHTDKGLGSVRIETVVRADLEEDFMEREDYDSIPVICIGYNGGYGRDLEELIEQQELILKTYQLRKAADGEREYNDGEKGISGKYLIVGHLPSGWNDTEYYEEQMTNAWGDHFVSLNEIQGNVLGRQFREGVAQTVYDKIEELGYLEK